MAAPEQIFKELMSRPDGWRYIAAVMIPPLRLALKSMYDMDMTKDQEAAVEAEVYRVHITKAAGMVDEFGYKEAILLQDKLLKEFKGNAQAI